MKTRKLKEMVLAIFHKRMPRTEELASIRQRVEELERRLEELERSSVDKESRKKVLPCLLNHLKMKGVSVEKAAEMTGIPYPALLSVMEGRKAMTRDQARRLAAAFGLNVGFLLHGNGKLTAKKSPAGDTPQTKGRGISEGHLERYYQNKYCS
jgi:hypothetical protein